jgi:predicted ATPase
VWLDVADPTRVLAGWARRGAKAARGLEERDAAQEQVALKLDALLDDRLYTFWPVRRARGLYVHGTVGTGKTVLLDSMVMAARSDGRRVIRTHFHEFMQGVHLGLRGRTLPLVAGALAEQASILALDEFQVNDVADAVLLHELFQTLFEQGMRVVATSNR